MKKREGKCKIVFKFDRLVVASLFVSQISCKSDKSTSLIIFALIRTMLQDFSLLVLW